MPALRLALAALICLTPLSAHEFLGEVCLDSSYHLTQRPTGVASCWHARTQL